MEDIDYKKYLRDYQDPGGAKIIAVYEDAWRAYNETLLNFFKGLFIQRNDKIVPVEAIYSLPNIAAALRSAPSQTQKPEINRELVTKLVDLREDRAKIPIIGFQISAITYAQARQLPGEISYKVQFVDDSKKDALKTTKPVPFDVQYTASIWTKTKSDMFFIHQQLLQKFNPTVTFNVLGQETPLFLDGIVDTSTLEVSQGQYQLVRYDVTMHLEAWVYRNMASVRTVHGEKLQINEIVLDGLAGGTLDIISR